MDASPSAFLEKAPYMVLRYLAFRYVLYSYSNFYP